MLVKSPPKPGLEPDSGEEGIGTRSAPIRVLYLDNTFTFGGAINSLIHLLRGIERWRIEPTVVSGHSTEFLKQQVPGVQSIQVELRLPWVHEKWTELIPAWFPKPLLRLISAVRVIYWFVARTVPEALQYVAIGRAHAVDLVHLNNSVRSQPAGVLAAKLLRVPCIAHAREFQEADWSIALYNRWVTRHVAISSSVRDNLVELGVDPARIHLVFNAVDLEEFDENAAVDDTRAEFGLKPGQPAFGLFGRIVEWKGTLEFVRAAALVVDRFPDARAFIVGDSSDGSAAYLDRVKACIEELHLREHVILTGYRSDVPSLMKIMDIVVHCSTVPEPFGRVLIEGMAMKKPIIASEGGGPDDVVVAGITGLIVPRNDVGALGGAIIALLENAEARDAMGRAGRKRVVEKFSKEHYAAEVASIYGAVLESSDTV